MVDMVTRIRTMLENTIIKRFKITIFVMRAAVITIAVALFVLIAWIIPELNVRYVPDYEKINLGIYQGITADSLSEEDYKTLFWQTGLGKDAVDVIFNSERDPVNTLEIYQENLFAPPVYKCGNIGIVTGEERLYDDEGKIKTGFLLADVRDGDIFVTRATHTLGWRHGHAAIVTDVTKGQAMGETLEAVFWGNPTMIQRLSKWRTYPTFIQLRPKNKEIGGQAAIFARENLLDINYSLFAGLFTKFDDEINITQCAHLPWYVYMHFGYDLDSNGGWLVTPRDITKSEHLEIVQIFGFHPGRLW